MRPFLALAAAAMLAGCAGQTKYVTTAKPFQGAVTPICVSKDDVLTESTASQIEGDNRALRSINKSRDECKQTPPTR